MKLTINQIQEIAEKFKLAFAELRTFISVESGGESEINGRIVIQFEPVWFRRKVPFAPSGLWSINKVENQNAEYKAFSNAFRINPDGAMEATSWGLPQIMGFHYKRLGYKTVGEMVDHFKASEYNQIEALAKFIATDRDLFNALKAHNWHQVAVSYNGAGYMDIAKKYNREPYNISLEKAYKKWSAVEVVLATGKASNQFTVTSNLNFRKSPGTGGTWILTIPKGSTVKELSRTADGWSNVIYNDQIGFVATQYLKG